MTKARMKVMSPEGHQTLEYDLDNPAEVKAIREEFDRIISGGMSNAYDTTTRPGEPVTQFPETATDILIAPQIAGG